MRQWSNNLQVRVGVGQVILIREIPSIVVSALIGGAIGVVSGFVDFAISQVTGGQKFNLNGALGAAANGAVVGVARGALAGTGVGIPLAFATDFAAGTLGSALEQCISEGKVSARKSVTRGLTNAASNMFYGTGTMKSIKEAFGRGFGAGAATSGINYISDAIGSRQGQPSRSKAGMAGVTDGLNAPVYGMFPNPRNNCGSESPFDTGLGYSSAKGYRYKTPQTRNGNGGGKGFSLAGFVRETLIGGVTGGLGSAAFLGTNRVVEELRESRRLVRSDIYYHVTTEENAQKIISSKQLGHSNWEGRVFAWRKQPTLRQASRAGLGPEAKTVLKFRTTEPFEKDDGITDKLISNLTRRSSDGARIPMPIKDIESVGFRKEWWEIWKK